MFCFLMFLLLDCTSHPTPKKHDLYQFAISPDISTQYLHGLEEVISTLLLQSMTAGDVLLLSNPHTGERKMKLRLSDKIEGKSPALRRKLIVKLHTPELRQLREFFESLRTASPNNSSHPHFFRYAESTANLKYEFPDHTIHLIWLAPIIVKDENQIYSFENRYPSDFHLKSEESVFSTVGKESMLSEFKVYMVLSPDMSEFFSPFPRPTQRKITTFLRTVSPIYRWSTAQLHFRR